LAVGGDAIYVRGGTYITKLTWTNSGTTSNSIRLSNYQSETVIVNGGTLPSPNLLTIDNKSNLSIEGIIFENNYMQGAKGIYVVGQGTNITISKCIVRNVGWTTNPNADPFVPEPDGQAHGILVNGRTSLGFTNVDIRDCRIYNIITGNSEALTIVGNVSQFTIQKDTVHDTKNIGIVVAGHYSWAVNIGVNPSLNQARNGTITQCVTYNNRRFSNLYAPAGIYSDGAKDINIFGNKSYQNGNGFSVGCENPGFVSRNIKVYNNLIYDNDNQGIYWGSNAAGSLIKQCTLKNNTFFYNGNLGAFYSEVSLQNGDSCAILQNIMIPKTSSHYAVSIFGYNFSNLSVDNNLTFRYNLETAFLYVPGTPPQFTPTNNLTQNPQFVSPVLPNPNLNLLINSPAINKGFKIYDAFTNVDFNLNGRIVNGYLDHGAIEHPTGQCQTTLTINNLMLLKGKFTAQTEVNINLPTGVIKHPIDIFCPQVKVFGNPTMNNSVTITAVGCL
jgi:hypothetical protein